VTATLIQNIRYALRQLMKSPGFTLTAVITLALGIGANTAIFTTVYATLLAPMPYPEPDQLVMVWSKIQTFHNGVSAGDFDDWRHQSTAFQALNAFTGGSFNLATKDQPEYVQGQKTTPGMYKMMGVNFLYGRDFLPEEGALGKEHVVVLVNKMWRKLGSDPNIVGKPWQIVGVFHDVRGGGLRDGRPEIEIPFWQIPWPSANFGVRTSGDPALMTRSIENAVHSVDPEIALAEPHTMEEVKSLVLAGDRFTMLLYASFALVALSLAAVGIYGVMAFTVAQREHEIGLRMALGASRGKVVGMILKEGMALALFGLGLGLVGAYFVGRALESELYGGASSISARLSRWPLCCLPQPCWPVGSPRAAPPPLSRCWL